MKNLIKLVLVFVIITSMASAVYYPYKTPQNQLVGDSRQIFPQRPNS